MSLFIIVMSPPEEIASASVSDALPIVPPSAIVTFAVTTKLFATVTFLFASIVFYGSNFFFFRIGLKSINSISLAYSTLTITSLIFIQTAYLKFGKGFEFFPPIEPDYAEIVIHARGNFSAIEKDKIVKKNRSRSS